MTKWKIDDSIWVDIVDRDIIEGGRIVKGKEKPFTRQIKGAGGKPPLSKDACHRVDIVCNGKALYFYLGD